MDDLLELDDAKAEQPEQLNEPPMKITEDNLDNIYVKEIIEERLGSALYRKLLAEKSLKRVPDLQMLQYYYQDYRNDILKEREKAAEGGGDARRSCEIMASTSSKTFGMSILWLLLYCTAV